jgi:photoactive yellow protein
MATKPSATEPYGVVDMDPARERELLRRQVMTLQSELTAARTQLTEMDDLRAQVRRLSSDLERLLATTQNTYREDPRSTSYREETPRPPSSREDPRASSYREDPRSPSYREDPRSSSHQEDPPRPASFVTEVRAARGAPSPPLRRDEDVGYAPAPLPVHRPEQGIDFGAITELSPAQLDDLPYGLITLDATGRVVHYNDTESRLVGLPKDRVVGRNFFQEVAPCTRLREFEGRFRELVLDPARVRVKTFDVVFRFPRGDQHVTVVMTPAKVRGRFHVALLRRSIEER